ncbi:MAG: SBBP repeat-containing protein [Armatimonadetes bacterium]|nr:SBBP repeat-containing protein [Armatimonadota bacterium]
MLISIAAVSYAAVALAGPRATAHAIQTTALPLTFEKNTGHWPSDVQFVARSAQGTLFLTKREMVVALRRGGRESVVRLKLQGSNPNAAASGLEKQPGIVNYLVGNDPRKWRTKVPTYSRARLAGVYPGIDLVTYGAGASRALEYDFVVKPGADPRRIRMAVSGAKSLRSVDGRLIASTACGDVSLNRPYAYQTINGVRRQVACSFALERDTVAFQIARYDASRPLVVDPTIVYSTYVGGPSDSRAWGMAVDASGAVTICGEAGESYPLHGPIQAVYGGGSYDACITKLNAGATALVYSTYLGGTGIDSATSVALDASGAATVAGNTASSNFPTTPGAYDTSYNGSTDAFVLKLAPDGASLAYATYLGGSSRDGATTVAVDGAGAAYVAGVTASCDFPTTAGAYSRTNDGGDDVFVAKFSSAGGAMAYGTYLGGSGADGVTGVVADSAGVAYICGWTQSASFPTTAGAYDESANGVEDAYVTKLNAAGTALVYSTMLGGSDVTDANGIAIDASGCAYATGVTVAEDFPTSPGAFSATLNGFTDSFVTKLNASGSDVVVAGYVVSTDFPTTPGVVQPAYGGLGDAFVTRIGFQTAASLAATGATGVVGEIVEFTATLTSGGSPVAGATVKFTTPDSVTTSRTTNASGLANLWYEIPLGASSGSVAVAFEATGSYQGSTANATLTVNPVGKLWATSVTGKQGGALTLYAYLWQGRTTAGLTGKQLTYKIDGGPAVSFATLTSGTFGKATSPYTIAAGMAVGDHTITVDWAGGGGYPAAQGLATLTVQAAPFPTYVWVHSHGATRNVATKLNCYLYERRRNGDLIPLAGKPISFRVQGTLVDAANTAADGKATLPYTPATTGALTQSMAFAGDAAYAASSNTGTLTVTP